MAGLGSILKALARAVWRETKSLDSIVLNQFFLFTLYFLPSGGAFVLLLAGGMLLFPLAADPLRKIPPDRLALWPLDRSQHFLLRLASLWLSPVVWITLALVLYFAKPQIGLKFFGLMLAIHLASLLFTYLPARAPQTNLFRYIPKFPGKLGGLIRKDLRESLTILDPYPAFLIVISARLFHHFVRPLEAEAWFGITLIVTLAFSTYAHCLFGLDSASGFTRYRLLPLRGWEILLAKDIAYLALLVPCVLPLRPLAGIGAGLAALAVGHHATVLRFQPQHRWRFTNGAGIGLGLIQVTAMFSLATMIDRSGPAYLAIGVAGYLASLTAYGRVWDTNST